MPPLMLLAEGDPTPIQSLLSSIGSYFTQCVTWMGNIMTFIISNPALIILCLAMPIMSFAIGLLVRLFRS